MYILKYQDCCGKVHIRKYKNIGCAISKLFKITGWYKNGILVNEKGDGVL